MSVAESAEEFILMHDLGRERLACVVLWSSVQSAQKSMFCPSGDDSVCLSILHISRQMCF